MKVKDIGEFGLIKKIARMTHVGPSVIKGIGDDCAVLKYTKNKYLLITTDMIIEDVHFKTKKSSATDIGHKAMAVNISDIAACGGIPRWAVISAGLPGNIDINFVNRIYKGIKQIADKYNIDIIGGDTNLAGKILISITLMGEVDKSNLLLRKGAVPGDIIFVTGRLLTRYKGLCFRPRLKESNFLNNFKINSMIDVSDGLLADLGHIISESKAGARLYESLIPYKGDLKKVLSCGEQFELLFTTDKAITKDLIQKAKEKRIKISAIGEITGNKGKIVLVDKNGRKQELKPNGFQHF